MSGNWQRLDCLKNIRNNTQERLAASVRLPPIGFKFVTQTLKPALYKHSCATQRSMTVDTMISILEYLCSDYCLIIELTGECNVHYHFWALFKDKSGPNQYYEIVKSVHRLGYTKISKENYNKSTLNQQVDTHNYMCKDLEETYKIIRGKIVYNKIPPDAVSDNLDTEIIEKNNIYSNSIQWLSETGAKSQDLYQESGSTTPVQEAEQWHHHEEN